MKAVAGSRVVGENWGRVAEAQGQIPQVTNQLVWHANDIRFVLISWDAQMLLVDQQHLLGHLDYSPLVGRLL
jgi:hypothetical protein